MSKLGRHGSAVPLPPMGVDWRCWWGQGLDCGRTAWSVSEDDEAGTDLETQGTAMARVGNSMTVVSSGGWSWWWGFSMEVVCALRIRGGDSFKQRNDGISFVLIEDDLFVLGTKRSKETS